MNTARLTSRLQHIVCSNVLLCLVQTGAKLCLESSTFKVYFLALDNDPTHATMFNTFSPDVLNSLYTEQKMVELYCTPPSNFNFI